ncbi:MAG TPA: hypothetical protein VGD77_04920 [Gemmatimonadaceae bacterium]
MTPRPPKGSTIVTILGAEDLAGDMSPSLRALTAPPKRPAPPGARRRYVVAQVLHQTFVLYYNAAEHSYHTNAPRQATLFRRPSIARAVQQVLGDEHAVIPCAVDARGQLDPASLKIPRRPTVRATGRKRSSTRSHERAAR